MRRSSRQASKERRVWSKQQRLARRGNAATVSKPLVKNCRRTQAQTQATFTPDLNKRRPGRPPKKKICTNATIDALKNNDEGQTDCDRKDGESITSEKDDNVQQESDDQEGKVHPFIASSIGTLKLREQTNLITSLSSSDTVDLKSENSITDNSAITVSINIDDAVAIDTLQHDSSQTQLPSILTEYRDRGQQKFDDDVKLTSLIIREGLQQPSLLKKVLVPFPCQVPQLSSIPSRLVPRIAPSSTLCKSAQDRISKSKIFFKNRIKLTTSNRNSPSSYIRNRKKNPREGNSSSSRPTNGNNVPPRVYTNNISNKIVNVIDAKKLWGLSDPLLSSKLNVSSRIKESTSLNSYKETQPNETALSFSKKSKVDAASSLLRKFRLSNVKPENLKDRKPILKSESIENDSRKNSMESATTFTVAVKQSKPADTVPSTVSSKTKISASKFKDTQPLSVSFAGPVNYIPELPIATTIDKLKARVGSKSIGAFRTSSPDMRKGKEKNSSCIFPKSPTDLPSIDAQNANSSTTTNIEKTTSQHSPPVSNSFNEAKKETDCNSVVKKPEAINEPCFPTTQWIAPSPSTVRESRERPVLPEIVLPSPTEALQFSGGDLLSPGSLLDGKVSLNAALAQLVEFSDDEGLDASSAKQTLTIHSGLNVQETIETSSSSRMTYQPPPNFTSAPSPSNQEEVKQAPVTVLQPLATVAHLQKPQLDRPAGNVTQDSDVDTGNSNSSYEELGSADESALTEKKLPKSS